MDQLRLRGHRRRSALPRALIAIGLAVTLVGCDDDPPERPNLTRPPAPKTAAGAPDPAKLTGHVVFVSERHGHKDVLRMRPDGSDVERLTHGPHDSYVGPSVGVKLLLIESDADGERIVLHGKEGSLGPRSRYARGPSWLPDGSGFVMESDAEGFRDLFLVALDGTTTKLTDEAKGSFEPDVSPDGKTVAFASPRTGDAEIFSMSLGDKAGDAAAEVQRLTWSPGEDAAPAWSPDGATIAFVSSRRGVREVFLMSPSGGQPRPLRAEPAEQDISTFSWSPSGSHVAIAQKHDGGSTVAIVAVASGESVTASKGKWVDEHPSWSPDGEYVVFASTRDDHHAEIYRMRRDGTAITRLTKSEGDDWLPRWIP